MNWNDFARIAVRGHRTAQLVADHAHRARQRARNSASPLRAATYDTVRSTRSETYGERDPNTGQMVTKVAAIPNDPTGETAMREVADEHGTSSLMLELRLNDALGDYEHAITQLTNLLLAIVPEARDDFTPLGVNDRAGIGKCEDCGKYCDGTPNNRLRPAGIHMFCNACRMRAERKKAKATT